jgi:uncharacterized protein DUF599
MPRQTTDRAWPSTSPVHPLPTCSRRPGPLLCWVGYTYYADGKRGQRNLTRVMHAYRALWARQMLQRDHRMVDAQIIAI